MMSLYDDRRVIACPDCKELIFSENLARHFKKIHQWNLSGAEIMQMLADARKNPIDPRQTEGFIERVYMSEENRPKIERTPKSMRQWGVNKRSGPLGPSK